MHTVFPRFFSYVVFQIVKSGILFLIYRYRQENYFDAYWTGNAISVLLAVTVLDEILLNLLKQYGGIQSLASLIFRWACGLLLLLSIVNAFSSQETSADRVVSAVLAFDRSVRLMQCGLCFLLLTLALIAYPWHVLRAWAGTPTGPLPPAPPALSPSERGEGVRPGSQEAAVNSMIGVALPIAHPTVVVHRARQFSGRPHRRGTRRAQFQRVAAHPG